MIVVKKTGTKNEAILKLVSRKTGASHDELREATGWKGCLGTAGQLARGAGKTLTIIPNSKPTRWRAV